MIGGRFHAKLSPTSTLPPWKSGRVSLLGLHTGFELVQRLSRRPRMDWKDLLQRRRPAGEAVNKSAASAASLDGFSSRDQVGC